MPTNYATLMKLGAEYLPAAIDAVRSLVPVPRVAVEVIATDSRDIAARVLEHNRFNPKPRDGYRYILATLRISNPTADAVSPGKWSHMINAVDAVGRQYEAVGMDIPDNATGAPMIGPGTTGVYFQIFEVLEAAGDLTWADGRGRV